MSGIVWVFPGQGEQRMGMLHDLGALSGARAMIDRASALLQVDLLQLTERGPVEELSRTAICQPLIFTMCCALVAELRQRCPGVQPLAVAGHSLGEYAALYAAEAASFEDLLSLVIQRAQAMERACLTRPGAMCALIGADYAAIARLLESHATIAIANINAPNQLVLSGPRHELGELVECLQAQQLVQRAVPLKVQGAFHSVAMADAADAVRCAALQVTWRRPAVPIILNATAAAAPDNIDWPQYLVQQMLQAVRWVESAQALQSFGPSGYLEIGPGNTLSALLRRCVPGQTVRAAGTVDGLVAKIEEMTCSSV